MNTNQIKAVFFDFDGVLTLDYSGSYTTCQYLSTITGIAYDTVVKAYRSYNEQLTLGIVTHADIWNDFTEVLHTTIDESHLIAAFESTPMNSQMLELAATLKKKGITLGIITDNKRDRMNHLRKLHHLDQIFDTIIVSAEVGFDKRCEEIFQRALKSISLRATDGVFIDNSEQNLVIPKRMGIRTILHDDTMNDVDLIRRRLVESEMEGK